MSTFFRTSACLAAAAAAAAALAFALPAAAAESPLAPSTCLALGQDLELGSKDTLASKDVAKLQGYLGSAGYLSTKPTGYFGPVTAGALAKFQAHAGLPAHGFVGMLTRAKLTEASCPARFALVGINTPARITAGNSTTWLIGVTLPKGGGSLTYQATWGDEASSTATSTPMQNLNIQNIPPKSRIAYLSLSHVYAAPGSYQPTFTITYGADSIPLRLSVVVQ